MILVTVTLSDWIFRSVVSKSVLTLHRDYFRLRKPLERRVYEIARKHCGRQAEWRIGLETLALKSGSTSPRRVFRKMVRDIAAEDALPDYRLEVTDGDVVRFRARGPLGDEGRGPPLAADVHERLRAAAPGYDPYFLEREWRAHWARSGRPPLRHPEQALLAFARARAARTPLR
jgi:plasmid replication initiation protein